VLPPAAAGPVGEGSETQRGPRRLEDRGSGVWPVHGSPRRVLPACGVERQNRAAEKPHLGPFWPLASLVAWLASLGGMAHWMAGREELQPGGVVFWRRESNLVAQGVFRKLLRCGIPWLREEDV
jgi:hypothetical protein